MLPRTGEHTLEFLLAFDQRVHWYARRYFVKFEIRRVPPVPRWPYGLRYSFTLHSPDGTRLVGFDNAHPIRRTGKGRKLQRDAADHWHRTEADPGRPYTFVNAETLIADFFATVEQVLSAHGIPHDVVKVSSED